MVRANHDPARSSTGVQQADADKRPVDPDLLRGAGYPRIPQQPSDHLRLDPVAGMRHIDQLLPFIRAHRLDYGHPVPGAAVNFPSVAVDGDLKGLPGAELVDRGIADLGAGIESTEALLVSIGAPRLRSVGIDLPSSIPDPEHKLYLRLAQEKGNAAHSAYNALIRRLVSFERAAGRSINAD